MTASQDTLKQDVLAQMESLFKQLQTETILLALPGLAIAGLVLFGFIPYLQDPGWSILTGALLFLAIPILLLINRYSFLLTSLGLVLVSFTAILVVIRLSGVESLVLLVVFPIGLATITLGTFAGMAFGIGASLFLAFSPDSFLPVSVALRVISAVSLWGIIAMIWLTLRPLLTAVQWSWSGYERSQSLLEQARESQGRLQQTLKDLTEANEQLTRLNQLANNLRQVAEEERRIKQQFVANVSHELRTPLNMIIGFCEMILKVPETYGRRIPANLLADLEVVLRNSQHLASLIDDVLDLSQIEAGQMALVKERANIEDIIASAAVAVRPLFESKGLYLRTAIESPLPEVYCDCTRIREVLLNLLSNAGRFTEQGGVVIRAWHEGQHLFVCVVDTGKGISAADQVRLFQPFQQLDGSIRRRYGGTGLGLSISKKFVELHEGKMWVESESGQGTKIYFRLPIDPPAPLLESYKRWINPYTSYAERDHPPELPAIRSRARIIVVENGNAVHRLLERYLENLEIVSVNDLDAGLQELRHSPANALIVNDIQIEEALHRLNDAAALPFGIPAIVCSIPGTDKKAALLGINSYLVKPISRETLLAALDGLGKPVKNLLLVDDEPDAQQLFRRMLSSVDRGYRVFRAYDGNQALELLSRQRIDVILLDLMMPEMDGFQFLAAKSQEPRFKDIPVILISARDPYGYPIVTNALAVTRGGGISVQQMLACIRALCSILAQMNQPAGPEQPGTPPGPRVFE